MPILTPIPCTHGDTALRGQIALPPGDGPHPAVLVMASAYGLGDQARNTAMRLANLGYAAIATDMYGDGLYTIYGDAVGKAMMPLHQNPDMLRARTVAWYETVAAHPQVDATRIAAIGYCFGGQCVLELARSGAGVKAVISFHGLLQTARPAAPGVIKGAVIAYCGGQDPYAPQAHIDALRAEMAAAGARHHITLFSDAAHSFTDPNAEKTAGGRAGIAYHPLADRVSWAGTWALLEAVLGGGKESGQPPAPAIKDRPHDR